MRGERALHRRHVHHAASAQCTDEMEARETGAAPGRAIASSTALVQSPSAGCRTASTEKALLGCPRHPLQHRRCVIILEHQHARASGDVEDLAGNRDAIGD